MQPQSSSTPIQNAERNSDNPVNDQADERETIVDDPTGRIPPWAFSLQNVQETTFGQETNSGWENIGILIKFVFCYACYTYYIFVATDGTLNYCDILPDLRMFPLRKFW